jgi:hypothetical protein
MLRLGLTRGGLNLTAPAAIEPPPVPPPDPSDGSIALVTEAGNGLVTETSDRIITG